MTAPLHKPVPKTVVERFEAYHALHGGWGSLHLVLGKQNIKDCHVVICRDLAIKNEDREGQWLCDYLLQMSKSQRIKLSRKVV